MPPTGLVGWWVRLVRRLGEPLARAGVHPDAVTLTGLVAALAVPALAVAGGRWALLAVLAVTVSGVLDGVDGAVALASGRSSRWGAVLDAGCDRVADTGYVAAFWLLGAPGWLCATGAGVAGLHEYLRARAGAEGMRDVGVITVGERPTRVIVAGMFLLGAGIHPSGAGRWALAGASAWSSIGVVALVQLLVMLRRRLR